VISCILLLTLSAAPASPERQVALRIESKPLLDHQVADAAEDTEFFVRTDSTRALSELYGARVVDGGAAPAIVVHLSWVSYAESIYRVRIETVRPGEAPALVESFACECADSELTAAVVARLPAALEQLEQLEQSTSVVSEPAIEPDPANFVVEPPEEPIDDPLHRPLGRLGGAGIGIAVVGAGALVGGGITYAMGTRFEPPTGRLEERDGQRFRPPGVALMASGGATLVAGAVLLIIDRRRARRSTSALLLPSPAGFVVAGRF
jgi:hypothetical protein